MSSFHMFQALPAEMQIQIWTCFHDLTPAYMYSLVETDNVQKIQALADKVKDFR
jgi:hypothetical protein